MDRFIVVGADQALKEGYPDVWWSKEDLHWKHFWCLYETDGERPIRLVGTDNGEPEDNLLVRDWKWVPVELNRLAGRVKELEAARRDLVTRLLQR